MKPKSNAYRKIAALSVLVALVLAACSSGSGTKAATGGSVAKTQDQKIDPNGVVRMSFIVPPNGVDPHKEANIGLRAYWTPIYDTLFDLGEGPTPKPMLGTDFSLSSDGLTATVTLRTDVKFQDGTPVDAKAVKASLERAKTLAGSTAKAGLANVTTVDAPDAKTVKLTLSKATPQLQTVLGGNAGAVINPKAISDGRDLMLNPGNDAGSGPYVLSQLVPNNKVVFVKAPLAYWQKGFQNLARLELTGIADYAAAQNALQAGQLEVSYQRADIDQLNQIAGRGFKLYDYVPLGAESLWLRNTREQFSNPLVRQAVARALDRKSIESGFFKGDCVDTSQIFPSGFPLHVDGLDPYPYDPEKAKQLLQQANAVGMPINMVSANAVSKQLEEVFQQQLNAVGFKSTVTEGTSALGTAAFAAGQIDARETVASLASAHPVAIVDQFYLPGGQFNLAGAEAAKLQSLRNKAADPTTSDADRKAVYQQMGTEITNQVWIVPICFSKAHALASSKILNVDTMLYTWAGIADPRRLAVAAA